MADNDDKKTYNRTPMSASTRPAPQVAPARTPEQQREMLALLKVSGSHNGKVSGESNDPAKAAIEKFQKANGLDPAKSSPDETLAKMREAVKNDPEAVNRMKAMAAKPDQDNAYAIQYGLRAKGAMITPDGRTTVDGKLDSRTVSALGNLELTASRRLHAAMDERRTDAPAPVTTVAAKPPTMEAPATAAGSTPTLDTAAPSLVSTQGNLLQMIFLAIAQALGINLTTLQQTQAGQQNKPPVLASTAVPATAAPNPTPTTAPPSPTPVVAKQEADEQRRDRLGMSPNQYADLLKAQQGWSPDQKRPSPFVMADSADKKMQEQLGRDDASWAALKKENQAWQIAKENGQAYAKTGPLQQALFASTSQTEPADPTIKDPAIIPVADRPNPAAVRNMQILAQGSARAPNNAADQTAIYESLRSQAANDPKAAAKMEALVRNGAALRIAGPDEQPGVMKEGNGYAIRMDRRHLQGNAPVIDMAIDRVIEAKQVGIESMRGSAAMNGMPLQNSEQRQIMMESQEIQKLQRLLPDYQPGQRMPVAPAESRPLATPVDYRPVPVRPGPRENFNANANVDLNVVNQMIQARAEYRNSGLAPQLAVLEVNNSRRDFLINQQGMNSRDAASLVNAESRAANIQEQYQITQNRQYNSEMQQAINRANQMDRQEAAAQARANREFGNNLGVFARGATILTGGNGRQAGAAADIGRSVPGLLGAFGIGANPPQSYAQSRAMGNDMGMAARGFSTLGGATGQQANATGDVFRAGTNILSRTGIIGGADQSQYRIITYPPQSQRGDYIPQPRIDQNPFAYDGGRLKERMAGAADDGVTDKQRADIIRNYEASRNGPAAAVPDAPVSKERMDMRYPGG